MTTCGFSLEFANELGMTQMDTIEHANRYYTRVERKLIYYLVYLQMLEFIFYKSNQLYPKNHPFDSFFLNLFVKRLFFMDILVIVTFAPTEPICVLC